MVVTCLGHTGIHIWLCTTDSVASQGCWNGRAVAAGAALQSAVGFGFGNAYDDLISAKQCSLAFTPSINAFAGRETVELKVKDIHF